MFGYAKSTWAFGLLFLLESFTRALNAGLLSLQAYDLVRSNYRVSMIGLAASGIVLCATQFLPLLLMRLQRRWVYTLGCFLLIVGCASLASFTLFGQIAGIVMRNLGAAITGITLQLYILDTIKKSDLSTSEPFRLGLSTVAWVSGPICGVYLYQNYGPILPQVIAMLAAFALLILFWSLGLKDGSAKSLTKHLRFNPFANIKKFILQPRLRLAWVIAFSRSCFWGTFFTYWPLLAVQGGWSKLSSSGVISISQCFLLAGFFFGPLAKKKGIRYLIAVCFGVISVAVAASGLVGVSLPLVTAVLLLVASFAASGVDAVGGIPYLRAVKFKDRRSMTPVYRSFLEISEFVPSIIFAVVLQFFPISSVFLILSFGMAATAWLSWRYVPQSMR